MITLRDYQDTGVGETRKFFASGKRHLMFQGPTGSGKTIIFSYIAQGAVKKRKKVLIITDRTELLMQTDGVLKSFGLDPFLIRAGTRFLNFKAGVCVAMCQTLRNRIKTPMWANWIKDNIDLVIIDEAHLQNTNYLFESGLLDGKHVIGFTATPRRSGKMRQLALDYEKIVSTVSVSELIEKDMLVRDDYFGVSGVDLNNIVYDKMKGDYSEKDMFSRFNSAKLYAGVVKNWLEIAKGMHTLVFCVNIEHAIHTCEEFHRNGIDAKFVVSKMGLPKQPTDPEDLGGWARYEEKMRLYELYRASFGKWSGERSYIINKFKKKAFPVLINAGILTTGFDCPEIEVIVVNRATLSPTLWLQMIGRGSRPSHKKESFRVLDFGENASRLGHYTAPQIWNLWHEESKGEGGLPPMKDCGLDNNGRKIEKGGCERLILAAYKICPFCGFKYPEKKAKEIDLSAIMYDEQRHQAIAVKKIKDMTDDEMYQYHQDKNHKMAWLWRELFYRGGKERIEEFGKAQMWKKGTIDKAINYCDGL